MKKTITTLGLITAALFANAQTIASYSFSNNANDASSTASHGTIISTNSSGVQFIKDRFGNANSAVFFDGLNGYIDCGNPSVYNNVSGLTISLWIKDTVATPIVECPKCIIGGGGGGGTPKGASLRTAGYQHILSKGQWLNGTETSFGFCINGNQPYGLINISQIPVVEEKLKRTEAANFSEIMASSTTFDAINDKAWHQLVMTWGTNGVAKFYLDGALVQTITNVSTNMNNTSAAKLFIGKSYDANYNFAGALDDIMIYNVTKSDADVLVDFNSAKPTGIEDDQFANKMPLAYPNPAKDVLHVSGSAEIFDLVGNKVASGTNEINMEDLLSGIYVVKANGRSQKIVKE
jgi:hypothetical protein